MNTGTHTPSLERSINGNYLLQICTLIFFLVQSAAYGQLADQNNKKIAPAASGKVELSIVIKSEAPNTSLEHVYLFKAVNTSDRPVSFLVSAKNMNCVEKKNTAMDFKVYWSRSEIPASFSNVTGITTVAAHASIEFYVKLVRPANTQLNTWNCTEVVATGINNNILSNNIVIESFIPDPKDFR